MFKVGDIVRIKDEIKDYGNESYGGMYINPRMAKGHGQEVEISSIAKSYDWKEYNFIIELKHDGKDWSDGWTWTELMLEPITNED